MEDNNINFPDTVSLDDDTLETLNKVISNQEKIIDQNQKIIDYFIPTDKELEELEKKELQEQKELAQKEKEEKELQEQKELELQEREVQIDDFNESVLSKLDNIGESLNVLSVSSFDNLEVNSVSSASMFLVLFTIVFTIIIYYLYRLIRAWFI